MSMQETTLYSSLEEYIRKYASRVIFSDVDCSRNTDRTLWEFFRVAPVMYLGSRTTEKQHMDIFCIDGCGQLLDEYNAVRNRN